MVIQAAMDWRLRMPTFLLRILHVVYLGTQKQVICVAASRIVTRMKNHLPRWYWTIFQGPSNLMRFQMNAATRCHSAIPIRVLCLCDPIPTFVRTFFVYLWPIALLQILSQFRGEYDFRQRLFHVQFMPHV